MYNYQAKLIRWIDGDSLLVEIDLGFYCTRQERIRLNNINAAEIKSESSYQRQKAAHARAVGRRFCPDGSTVIIQTHKNKKDMYARYLADVFFNGINLSDYLLEKAVVEKFE